MCWPAGAPESSARFATSKELFDHSKIDHAHDPPGEKPFRCALAGCGKAWKVFYSFFFHPNFFSEINPEFEWRPVSFANVMSIIPYLPI